MFDRCDRKYYRKSVRYLCRICKREFNKNVNLNIDTIISKKLVH